MLRAISSDGSSTNIVDSSTRSNAPVFVAHRVRALTLELSRQERLSRALDPFHIDVDSRHLLLTEAKTEELNESAPVTAPYIENFCGVAVELHALQRADIRAVECEYLESNFRIPRRSFLSAVC